MNVQEIALDLILPPRIQPRLDPNDAGIQELAASIKRHGLISPLTVTPDDGNYRLLAGNRRLQALLTIGATTAPCNVITPTTYDPGEITLAENLIRLNLSPVEEAYAFALRLGQERTYVTRRLLLLDLDDITLGALQEGIIGLSQALLLRRIEEPGVRERFIEHAQTYGANVRVMQHWVTNFEKEQARAAATGEDVQQSAVFEPPRQTFMACDRCGDATAYDLLRPAYLCPDCKKHIISHRALQEIQK
jgi:ParB family chromosome partitioning protein